MVSSPRYLCHVATGNWLVVIVVKATKNKPGIAKSVVEWFIRLYAIEKQLKEDKATSEQIKQGLSPYTSR